MIKVREYFTPSCPMCSALKKRLESVEGIEKEFIDLTVNNPMGATQAPWVIIEKDGEVIMNEHPSSIGKVMSLLK